MPDQSIIAKMAYSVYEKDLEKDVRAAALPQHIAIIMDGNRRYAREFLGNDVDAGHEMGEKKIEEMMDWCLDLGIRYVTIFAFSNENFKRNDEEVNFLMELAAETFRNMADNPKIQKNHVRIRALGDMSSLPENVVDAIEYADEKTGMFTNFTVSVCMAYSGRAEIVSAVKDIAEKVRDGDMDIEEITEASLSRHLYTADLPDPDLMLRTSGEVRVSNFLLWQLAYSELYFTDVYWPGFRYIDLLRAIRTYQQRIRRYGE